MNKLLPLMLTVLLGVSPLAVQAADDHADHMKAGSSMAMQEMSEGVVKKVDAQAGKITIQHGPLKNLDMPAMTMVFKVKDAAMLGSVKAGDNVRFVAESLPGGLTVTSIEKK
ncbi:copper-binding protein [Niveibacterium sp.]|uniref:copper-binding protein n=1 Tax=Niveibacterium sp. TaxID=2017444 RepID=UPI0035B360AC